jgi:hypothetical protein
MLKVDSGMVASIKNFLMSKHEKENELNELRSLFGPALNFVKMDVHNLFVLYRDQLIKGESSCISSNLAVSFTLVI